MVKKISQVNLIDPYERGVIGSLKELKKEDEFSFVDDLLIRPVNGVLTEFEIPDRGVLDELLTTYRINISTAKYRQELLKEIEKKEKELTEVNSLMTDFNFKVQSMRLNIEERKDSDALNDYLSCLYFYTQIPQSVKKIGKTTSKGLRGMVSFLEEEKLRPEYKAAQKIMGDLERGVSFSVTLKKEEGENAYFKVKNTTPPFNGINEEFFSMHNLKHTTLANICTLGIKELFPEKELSHLNKSLSFYLHFTARHKEIKKHFDTCYPVLLTKEAGRTSLKNVMNPLLVLQKTFPSNFAIEFDKEYNALSSKDYEKEAEKVNPVGNDFVYDSKNKINILTGPNNGGKTTWLRTIGLTQLFAQNGFPIFASEGEISMIDGVYTNFVNLDNLAKGEGSYKAELLKNKKILQKSKKYDLILLDELCRGTTPETATEKTLDILKAFQKKECPTYLTTHLIDVAKKMPGSTNYYVDAKINKNKMEYLYKLKNGITPLKEYGEYLAKEVGMGKEDIEKLI